MVGVEVRVAWSCGGYGEVQDALSCSACEQVSTAILPKSSLSPFFFFPKTGRHMVAVVMDYEIRLCAVTNFACVL